ncbi:MAG: hypothetical protein ABI658_29800 [Acidimicrobiales bacterium]
MVIVAVVAVVAATIAWLCLRRTARRVAPNFVDLVIVVLVSLAAAITVGAPVV